MKGRPAEIGNADFAMIAVRAFNNAGYSNAIIAVRTAAGAEVSAQVTHSLAPFAESQS